MTIREEKFKNLMAQYANDAEILPLPCPGLMDFVERGDLHSDDFRKYLEELLYEYRKHPVDAAVLGCTHYPFAKEMIQEILGKDVVSLDVSGLTIGKEYTFTVKAFDESLNYSKGAEVKATVADTADYTAPANVKNLVATNKDASVLLTWTDATDEDIYGYEVTWNKNAPINRSAAMESNSMMVAPGAKGCYISNLTNGTEYAFTVKSVDTSGNKSAGVTKTITKKIAGTLIKNALK